MLIDYIFGFVILAVTLVATLVVRRYGARATLDRAQDFARAVAMVVAVDVKETWAGGRITLDEWLEITARAVVLFSEYFSAQRLQKALTAAVGERTSPEMAKDWTTGIVKSALIRALRHMRIEVDFGVRGFTPDTPVHENGNNLRAAVLDVLNVDIPADTPNIDDILVAALREEITDHKDMHADLVAVAEHMGVQGAEQLDSQQLVFVMGQIELCDTWRLRLCEVLGIDTGCTWGTVVEAAQIVARERKLPNYIEAKETWVTIDNSQSDIRDSAIVQSVADVAADRVAYKALASRYIGLIAIVGRHCGHDEWRLHPNHVPHEAVVQAIGGMVREVETLRKENKEIYCKCDLAERYTALRDDLYVIFQDQINFATHVSDQHFLVMIKHIVETARAVRNHSISPEMAVSDIDNIREIIGMIGVSLGYGWEDCIDGVKQDDVVGALRKILKDAESMRKYRSADKMDYILRG